MRFTALPRAGLAMSSKGEVFQQFMHEAYGIEPEPEQEEKPTGPRRPAPVPEAGHASNNQLQSNHADLHEFHETLKHWSGAYYYHN